MNQEDLIIKSSTLGFVGTNCYFVAKKSASVPVHGIVIDPAYDGKKIYEDLKAEGCVVDLVLLTHAHFDHIGGACELCELSGAPLYCHALEKDCAKTLRQTFLLTMACPVRCNRIDFWKMGS